MKYAKYIFRSLFYYRRRYFGVFLGVTVSTGVLVGSLLTGDSVRYSLRHLALSRLGKTEVAVTTGDRFCRAELADEISSETHPAVPLLRCSGICVRRGGELRVNNVQVFGVEDRFWKMAQSPVSHKPLKDGEVMLNSRLASRLELKTGDSLLLRVEKSGSVPLDLPFVSADKLSQALTVKVAKIITAEEFGNFSLEISQVAPLNLFMPLSVLSTKLDLPDRVNTIISTNPEIESRLKEFWMPEDAGLSITNIPDGFLKLQSERIFIDSAVCDAAMASGKNTQGVFSYFVNEFKYKTRTTPYSFVASWEGFPAEELLENEIAVNEWLADDLEVSVGDAIEMKYYVVGPMRQLSETSRMFTVKSVVPIEPVHQNLIPHFPGLADSDKCAEWNSSLPITMDAVRDKDEKYWDDYRGTPKAYVSVSAAQDMWKNAFGCLTAVRYPSGLNNAEDILSELSSKLNPALLGVRTISIREKALNAGNESVDFGQLFLGLSFFIIAAALILTGMLFVFEVENRREETGSLLAMGYEPCVIKRILLAEGGLVAILGGMSGAVCGILYNKLLIYMLGSVWRGAVGTSALCAQIAPATLLLGSFTGIIAALISIWIAVGCQLNATVAQLHSDNKIGISDTKSVLTSWLLLIGSISGVAAIIAFMPVTGGQSAAGAFFGAGFLLLIGLLSACNLFAIRKRIPRKGRSLATVALISCGIFLVIAVAANRNNPQSGADLNNSGTGGFELYGESSLPILYDLNSQEGKNAFPLGDLTDLRFVQLLLREGDDASCLNLNRIETPRILGVDPSVFSKRQSFSFADLVDGIDADDPWLALDDSSDADTVFAIADQAVITWGFGKKVGDVLPCMDDKGKKFKLKLVAGLKNSVFQGSVIISREKFRERFSSVNGSRVILADIDKGDVSGLRKKLTVAMEDVGMEVEIAPERLAEFAVITNTYLSIFLMLGGLGVVLGTIGLGVVVMRNVLERRSELAIMRAVGFERKEVSAKLFREHWPLVLFGVLCGTLAGVIAVLPAILSSGTRIPVGLLTGLITAILANGAVWILLAARLATKGDLISALRDE